MLPVIISKTKPLAVLGEKQKRKEKYTLQRKNINVLRNQIPSNPRKLSKKLSFTYEVSSCCCTYLHLTKVVIRFASNARDGLDSLKVDSPAIKTNKIFKEQSLSKKRLEEDKIFLNLYSAEFVKKLEVRIFY